MWYTPEMLYDPTFLWARVADAAFNNSNSNGSWRSRYCVHGSTGHPTSLSGGLKNGTLGPQSPPPGAFTQVRGWLLNGTVVTNSTDSSPAMTRNGSTVTSGADAARSSNAAVAALLLPVLLGAMAIWS